MALSIAGGTFLFHWSTRKSGGATNKLERTQRTKRRRGIEEPVALSDALAKDRAKVTVVVVGKEKGNARFPVIEKNNIHVKTGELSLNSFDLDL
jgi:hypothetical protein